ncbi:MAG TPA: nucleotide exchange factor GrpE [Ignavibacteria bacterium]|nr:nucleotide exchange factor GrpE [Ignavibacteria bacterium]
MTKIKKEKQEKEIKEKEIKINGTDESAPELPDDNPAAKGSEQNRIEELEKQAAQFKDQYLRTAAEFENYKRRTDAERAEFFAYAGERVLGDMLPVLDDFDRTMESFEKSHDKDALKKGIDLVYAKFTSVLEKQGLKAMRSDGTKFDVNLHEAILQQPDESKEPETILNTVEKGYFLKDKVLRHAKVVVSSKPE